MFAKECHYIFLRRDQVLAHWPLPAAVPAVALPAEPSIFGDGELYRLFFRWRSSEAKLTRRRRVRLLIRLNRLTEANSIEAISERGSRAYAELVDILRELVSSTVASAART
jgi:hypothetical protein